jgi:hypothetical protein
MKKMGRPTVITDHVKEYIGKHYHKQSMAEMARNLGISLNAVQNYMVNNRLTRVVKKKAGRRAFVAAPPPDCFNVHELENWLA